MCVFARSFATQLPTRYQIVDLAVASVQLIAQAQGHTLVTITLEDTGRLCKDYGGEFKLTETDYPGTTALCGTE